MDQNDMWVDDLLKDLPSVPVRAGLQHRILADFDAQALRRRSSLLGRFRDAVWPGAPLWRPATILAAALVMGVVAGNYVPLEDAEQTASIALDQPPAELGGNS